MRLKVVFVKRIRCLFCFLIQRLLSETKGEVKTTASHKRHTNGKASFAGTGQMKKISSLMKISVAPAAILACLGTAAWSDTLADDVLVGTSGDGAIFSDPAEGVEEPGIRAVTFTRTRVGDGEDGYEYVDPFEVILTDFSDMGSRGEVTNCLMTNQIGVYCDAAGGSGKRVKTWLTGRNPFDIRLRTVTDSGYPSVDYFTYGKTSNFTGARLIGFDLELLDSNGNPMSDTAAAQAVLYNLDATALGIGARLPDGLFGDGGNEGEIGFFSDGRASLTVTTADDTLSFGALSNADYVANFGTGFLDNSMVPDGLFWDDNDNPDDEAALIAWTHHRRWRLDLRPDRHCGTSG